MQLAQPPFALAATSFRFPALASLAGRSVVGGQREVVLAVYLAARLAHDSLPARGVTADTRSERSAHARSWLSTLTLPANVRAALSALIDASAGEPGAAAPPLRAVTAVTANSLDGGARYELEQLAVSLSGGDLAENR